ETSYGAALHTCALEQLRSAGHEVDDCDLYGEGFDPRLTRQERLDYHAAGADRSAVAAYIERVRRAEGLVLCYPVWNFGYPAILKGFFDRVFLPGVSFRMVEGRVETGLLGVRKVAAITTYGGTRLSAFLVGDPPRKAVMRVLRGVVGPTVPFRYLAHYDMNRSTPRTRKAFL